MRAHIRQDLPKTFFFKRLLWLTRYVPRLEFNQAFVGQAAETCAQPPASTSESARILLEEWQNIPQRTIRNVCWSMTRRFAPSPLRMEVIPGTSELNHIFDASLIDIHINGSLFVNKIMLKKDLIWIGSFSNLLRVVWMLWLFTDIFISGLFLAFLKIWHAPILCKLNIISLKWVFV